jgi:hypothetical protein
MARRDTIGAGAAEAHLAMIKRFCKCALTILAAGGAVAGVIALKAAVHISSFSY